MTAKKPTQFLTRPHKGDIMSAEDKARLATLEAENETLKKQQADFAEAQNKTRRDASACGEPKFC